MKIARTIMLLAVGMLLTVGCTTATSASVTYNVDNGDRIRVTLDTSDGHGISASDPFDFDITKDGETLSNGLFISTDDYDMYVSSIKEETDAVIIIEGTTNGVDYVFYEHDVGGWVEYNYFIRINNSNTGLIVGNPVSRESAQECFDRLTFTKE